MSVEELGLCFASVAALTIPPTCAVAVENGARGTFNGDVGTGDRNERTGPLLVTESGGSLEDDLWKLARTHPRTSLIHAP